MDEIIKLTKEDFESEQTKECPTCSMNMSVFYDGDILYCEYEKEVFVQCACGELLQFVVPVN